MEEDIQSSADRERSPPARDSQGADAQDDLPAVPPGEIESLTRRMAEGDEMAWRAFYQSYFDRLWRYLLVVAAGNEDAAREALQAALLRVARHIRVFHNEKFFWNWLAVVVRTAFADERKKSRRYFSFLERFISYRKIQSEGAAENQANDRLNSLLEQKIASLPADEQKLIEEKYFARRAVREIAEESQTTEKAVESKLSRVRKKLKDAVLAELKDEPEN